MNRAPRRYYYRRTRDDLIYVDDSNDRERVEDANEDCQGTRCNSFDKVMDVPVIMQRPYDHADVVSSKRAQERTNRSNCSQCTATRSVSSRHVSGVQVAQTTVEFPQIQSIDRVH